MLEHHCANTRNVSSQSKDAEWPVTGWVQGRIEEGMAWEKTTGGGETRVATLPATPRHTTVPLRLLPSGPDRVHGESLRGDRQGRHNEPDWCGPRYCNGLPASYKPILLLQPNRHVRDRPSPCRRALAGRRRYTVPVPPARDPSCNLKICNCWLPARCPSANTRGG